MATVDAQTSGYWMQRVADAAVTLSAAKAKYKAGRLTRLDLKMAQMEYDVAYKFYTDPFNSKTYG